MDLELRQFSNHVETTVFYSLGMTLRRVQICQEKGECVVLGNKIQRDFIILEFNVFIFDNLNCPDYSSLINEHGLLNSWPRS